MADPRELEIGGVAAGVSSRVPQHVVHQSALTLRQLLDAGVPPNDPRCVALVQLVNSARLLLLPNSNNGAKLAADLTSKAVHVDVSTATMAAIMGLKNASNLTGIAVAEANRAKGRNATQPSSSNPNGLKVKLLPKLSQQAFNALLQLVRTDADLGARAQRQANHRSSSMAAKMHRLRAGQRHASVRKRRLSVDGITEEPEEKREESLPPMPAPPPVIPLKTTPGMNSFQPATIVPRRPNIVLANPVSLATPIAPRPMGPSRLPPPPPLPTDIRRQAPLQAPVDTPPRPTPSFSRLRARQTQLQQSRPERQIQQAISNDKGVMNDTIGTPDEVMEAFLHPADRTFEAQPEQLDNQTKVRAVLAERERILYRLLKRRRAELAAMPLGMTEQTRRKAIIEAKQLSLLDLQRVVRYRVCAEMKKMNSLAVQEEGCVPADNLSRLFRRRDPPIYSYTDGYPRITPFDGIPEMPPRHPSTIAQDSIRMAQFDMSRMVAQKVQARKEFNGKLLMHFVNFKNAVAQAKNGRARIWKGLERYLLEKKRAEERKRKLERIERLRLLRSNDEQAYFKLLKNTKNERLLQLVRQTDSYLMRIGAQVEKERDTVDGPPSAGAHNAFTEELSDASVPIDAMRRRRDLYYTVTHAVQEEVRQPSIMVHGTLKPYQVEGLKWMVSLYNNNLNGILADEMGLGKTIQTISLLTYLVEMKKNPGPYLIIVPLSTMGNWVRELDLWAPSLVKVVYRGNRPTRRNIQQLEMAGRDFNVLLTTYEFTVKDQHVLSRINWKYIIIDEGHRMKNANCKLAMTLGVKYKSRNRLLLTGTPLQNNLTELWALLNFLLPTIFSSSDTFETWFKQPFESTTLGDTAELEEEETLLVINRLHQVLRPFLLRRLKTDVESQLPSKVEHVIHCEMSSWQRVIYRQVKDRIGLATGTHNGGVKAFNNLLMQCKKICNHPYLFYDPEAIDFLPQDYLIRASGKFALLQHMLPKLRLNGHRTLIFSQMTAALDYLEYFLTAIGISYLRLDGNTRADDRQELLNQFNAKDSPYFCFLLSTRAGGLGLNLQTADTVVIFDSDWNPMMDLQAQDRAHRIGQTRVVRVYRLICSGTVEVKILEQANRKLQVDAQVIQAGQFNNKSTENDRHQMLKDLLRQRNDDEGLGDVPSMEELNRLFARSDEEYEEFVKLDKTSRDDGTFKPLFTTEDELPEWVLQPDVDHKTAEEKEQEVLMSHGRGRRKRKAMHDMDLLTEAEWFKVVEGEMTVEEAFERRRRRKERRRNGERSNAEDASTETEDESGDVEPSTDETKGPVEDPDFAAAEGTESADGRSALVTPESTENEASRSAPVNCHEETSPMKSPSPGVPEFENEAQAAHPSDCTSARKTGKMRERRRGGRKEGSTMTRNRKSQGQDRGSKDIVHVRVRLRAPLSQRTKGAGDIGSDTKKRARGDGESVLGSSIGTVSPDERKKQKRQALVENPVAVEMDNAGRSSGKIRNSSVKKRRKRRHSPNEQDDENNTGNSPPAEARKDSVPARMNSAGEGPVADEPQEVKNSVSTTPRRGRGRVGPGKARRSESKDDHLQDEMANGDTERPAVRKRRKIVVIPPRDPRSVKKAPQGKATTNGKCPDSPEVAETLESESQEVQNLVSLKLRLKRGVSNEDETENRTNGKKISKKRRVPAKA